MAPALYARCIWLAVVLCLQIALGAPFYKPVLPPSYPLAVRNPYLNAWLPGKETWNLPFASAQFWYGQNLTWSVVARVDGQAYSLFGVPSLTAGTQAGVLQSAEYTSTHTTFTVAAGAAMFLLDFLSPISPQNYVRQSAPFSYLTVSATGRYGATPDVQVYSDIDNTWLGHSDNNNIDIEWGYILSYSSTSVFTITPKGVPTYGENDQMGAWGTAVYCTRPSNSEVSKMVGDQYAVRAGFAATGNVTGPWEWQAGSVAAYGHDMGEVSKTSKVTFAIGYWRQSAVNYLDDSRTAYFTSVCKSTDCACVHVMDDFEAADADARTLDAKIAEQAEAVAGANYSDIVTLSARQAFGAMDLTIPQSSLDTNDVMAFVKEISSDGNVNTIDIIFPMAPMFYVLAPDYLRLLLEPVMQYLASGKWPHNYAIHDLGAAYPNATGHDNGTAEYMPVEECGNLLILAYMYQQATGDKKWADKYQDLFQQYAAYLVPNGLFPAQQLSSDDGLGDITNQTTLAIKSAIALNAYGVLTGNSTYSSIGKHFAYTLYNQTVGTDPVRTHFTCIQSKSSSWSLEYNLYMDVLLKLNTFPSDAYAMQSAYYKHVRMPGGVPLDSLVDWGKTDWMIWAAATAMAPGVDMVDVQEMFVNDVHAYMANRLNTVPFSDKFHVQDNGTFFAGEWNQYEARPVVGGHFAIMALGGAGPMR